MSRVAVVGLGGMGSRIAERLLGAGHEVLVWNRSADKAARLVERGASSAGTPALAAAAAEAVLIMVADPEALRAVTDGDDGILAGAGPGTTVVQMSTVGPEDVAELAAKLPAGVDLLDSPVLGSLSEVEEGTLKVFASGDAEVVERLMPLLSALGTVLYLGPVGTGTAAKLVANSTLLGTLAVLGEALGVARALGLPDDKAFEVLAATPLAAQAERRRKAFETGDYPLRFPLALGRKDAELIAGAAHAAGLDAKVAAAVAAWAAEAEQAGLGAADYSRLVGYIAGQR
jgi:3-hydroxyisobutyrate dehydrogenase-like beta-hydroxyacid dehydrogenase